MKYIDADHLKAKIRHLKIDVYDEANQFDIGARSSLTFLESFIDSLQQEQENVAEGFARIVRGNLIGIDKEVQQKFENLYLEVTGNKMYGGYND